MNITFIQTGGTIDKDYPKNIGGWAFEIGEAAVIRILEKLSPSFQFEVLSLLRKDSQEITAEDRQLLKESCEKLDTPFIIITHGTDTLIETAVSLMGIKGKTIVLTGAMRPERFSNTDAEVNVGIAIGAVQSLPQGVYVAMHGRALPADQLSRNPDSGQFVENE